MNGRFSPLRVAAGLVLGVVAAAIVIGKAAGPGEVGPQASLPSDDRGRGSVQMEPGLIEPRIRALTDQMIDLRGRVEELEARAGGPDHTASR